MNHSFSFEAKPIVTTNPTSMSSGHLWTLCFRLAINLQCKYLTFLLYINDVQYLQNDFCLDGGLNNYIYCGIGEF